MKYEIDGIEKGRTIKSVQVIDTTKPILYLGSNEKNKIKVIMVDYLDGTQDVVEFNEETLKRIQNIVDSQAQTFVNKEKGKFPAWLEVNVILSGIAIVLSVTGILVDKMILFGIISAAASLMFGVNAVRINAIDKNVKKHKIYVEKIMGKLEEYNEILKKENALSKEVNKNLVDIINIDKKSVKELEQIGNKIERYNEIEGKSPKKKSL